jgi:hypothetical protein
MLDFTTRLITLEPPAGATDRILDALSAAVRGARYVATSVGRGEHTPPIPGQPDGAYAVFDLATAPSAAGEHDKFLDAARQALADCRIPYAWCSGDNTWRFGPGYEGRGISHAGRV